MAEAVMLVCDICGQPAVQSVKFRIGARNREKDYCARHLAELENGSRAPRRGRRRVIAEAPKRRGRPPGSKNKNPSGNGRRRRRTGAKAARAS